MITKDGWEWRVHADVVQRRNDGGAWEDVSRLSLLEYKVDSPLWVWLREKGVRRPAPTQEEDKRAQTTTKVTLRLPKQAAEDLEALAEEDDLPKAVVVSELITKERARRERKAK